MGKIELLAPAGNMEALKAAIHAGADAVYLSGKKYGAQQYAENFTNEEIIEAIKYAHIYDVKVYITANTLIYEDEIKDFIKYIIFLYLNGVDAVLMQDIGMISLVRKIIPDLEIHASTQTHNCNDETLKLFKDIGIKRVVLARELSIKQINNLKTNIEKEVFIHGALCICYSGECLFSALNGGRSANRGQCAGPCRLPYKLIKNGKEKSSGYLLSTKELNTSSKLSSLLNSNIDCLKIEGRMKNSKYVYFVTKMYRDLIDEKRINKNTTENLKKLFNRQFTTGHLFNDNIMNPNSPNHIGIKIGHVIDIKNKIKIKLDNSLSQYDGIRFKNASKGMIVNKLYNEKGFLINKANKNSIVYLDNKINLKENDIVLKTTDYNLEKDLQNYPLKKLKLNIEVKAFVGKPLNVTFIHNNKKFTFVGKTIEKSITAPISKEKIKEKLAKLGNTPFCLNSINIYKDKNIFIPVHELNEIKRNLIKNIINEKTKTNRVFDNNSIKNILDEKTNKNKKSSITISVYVCNEENLKAVLPLADYIYTDDYNLYKKYKNKKVFFRTNRTAYKLRNFKNENLMITNLGDLHKYSSNNLCHCDYFLNIINSKSSNFFEKYGVKKITLSPELSLDDIKKINHNNNLEVIIYGRSELMIIKDKLVGENGCYFKNFKGNLYPIILKNTNTIILSHNKINLLNQIQDFKEIGIYNFRFNFYDESKEEIIKIIKSVL